MAVFHSQCGLSEQESVSVCAKYFNMLVCSSLLGIILCKFFIRHASFKIINVGCAGSSLSVLLSSCGEWGLHHFGAWASRWWLLLLWSAFFVWLLSSCALAGPMLVVVHGLLTGGACCCGSALCNFCLVVASRAHASCGVGFSSGACCCGSVLCDLCLVVASRGHTSCDVWASVMAPLL